MAPDPRFRLIYAKKPHATLPFRGAAWYTMCIKSYRKGAGEMRSTGSASKIRRSRTTEAELAEAIFADEAKLGRTHIPSERDAFVRGFTGTEYAAEIRHLAAMGLLDEEDGEEGA